MKYSASFKLQVVKFASDNSNNSAASRKFGIDEKLVRDWRRKIDNIKSLPKTKCADCGRKCQWPEWTGYHNSNYLLIGQKARSSGCDWFSQLSDNRCPITAFVIGHSPDIRLIKGK